MTAGLKLLVMAAVGLPLLWLLLAPIAGRWLRLGLPLLPLPALVLALGHGGDWQWPLPWLLVDSVWLMDDLRRVFLTLTAMLWCSAGLFAIGYLERAHERRFIIFWCLTLCGNIGLTLAGDAAGFYTFFALMTFASYGLVVHQGSAAALRAGRVYLVMAVLGELMLLAGLMLAVASADSDRLADLPAAIAGADRVRLITGLLLAGFGIKAGLPLLHMWLPLAHPVAPTPASAVLSGAMIKAGLLGWLLTLPLGHISLVGWGDLLVAAGALASIGGALVGVCQRQGKAVLAYSSISQMGLMLLLVAGALATPEQAGVLVSVTALYALHHGLAKGVLFLSSALRVPESGGWRWLMWGLIAMPGFALAGLPWTSGALAKLAMKKALVDQVPGMVSAPYLSPLLSAGAVATLLLVLRFLWLQRQPGRSGTHPDGHPPALLAGWLLATLASLVLFWFLPWRVHDLVAAPHWLPKAGQYLSLLWPIGLGLALAVLVALSPLRAPAIPPGDLLAPLTIARRWLRAAVPVPRKPALTLPGPLRQAARRFPAWSATGEQWLRAAAVLVMTALILLMAGLL